MEYTVNLGKESLKKIANAIGGVDVQELEVTQNGVYTAPDGKAYSPVRVNVESGGGGGSSDFSTAEVTVKFEGIKGVSLNGAFIDSEDDLLISEGVFTIPKPTRTIVLYKGKQKILTEGVSYLNGEGGVVELGENQLLITGNCELTFGRAD